MNTQELKIDQLDTPIGAESTTDTVTVPREEYDFLVTSSAELETIRKAYSNMKSYDVETVMEAIFGKETKYQEKEGSYCLI